MAYFVPRKAGFLTKHLFKDYVKIIVPLSVSKPSTFAMGVSCMNQSRTFFLVGIPLSYGGRNFSMRMVRRRSVTVSKGEVFHVVKPDFQEKF
ncbi:hypothetical protein NPIL_286001 [Nephila pilipes]|uniref:Uncharacterized protein n=1 Tax=Nephila pilipes TaxID=299642 RepID=A0A8X6Q8Z8_NEPPI|nr:hypothetical protein NPIL_286001 [Nephila pilipes]